MESHIELLHYGPGIKETISCELLIAMQGEIPSIRLSCDKFSITLYIRSADDLSYLHRFISGTEKKIVIDCFGKILNKEYKGKRKIVWRKDSIALSLGGRRFEIGKEGVFGLSAAVNTLAQRMR